MNIEKRKQIAEQIKEQLNPLVWSSNLTTNTATHSYRINELGSKFIVTYCKIADNYAKAKEATGFITLDDAKVWAFEHHAKKMAQWVKPDALSQTLNWFKTAKPEPTDKDITTQIGCHFEEVSEMSIALNCDHSETDRLARCYKDALEALSSGYLTDINKTELFDALLDQIVTAVGVGYMMGLDMIGGLNEVNASNFSKFVDGKAITDDNGKIIKGDGYFKPDLTKFMGVSDD